MNILKVAAAALIAVIGLLGTVSSAFAYDATATTTLNVRTGPGTNYRVIGALSPNQIVNVVECNAANTWCRVQDRTLSGWASARYLRPIETGPSRPQPAPGQTQPNVGVSVNTPNFSFSFGTGAPSSRSGQVCFFEDFDYRGRSFCVADGDNTRYVGNFWNDRIRSARVEGNISATVCTGTNYSGRCGVIDRSVRNLGMLSDNISSYYVGRR